MENKINVLIPTDFTANANNALQYGIAFLEKFNCDLFLLNVYEPYEIGTEVPVFEVIEKENEEKIVKIKNQLETSSSFIHKQSPDLPVKCITEEGNPAKEIIATSVKRNINLIVTGYTTKSPVNRLLFGNITNKIIEKSACPVLVVPQDVTFNGIKNIAYAARLTDTDIWKINQLAVFAKAYNATLHVIHISEWEKDKSIAYMKEFESETRKSVEWNKLVFESVLAKTVVRGIEEYIHKTPIDLLSLSTDTRLSLEKLYNSSVAETLSSQIHIPLLIFHYTQEDQ